MNMNIKKQININIYLISFIQKRYLNKENIIFGQWSLVSIKYCSFYYGRHEWNIRVTLDGFQPKISSSISFYGTYQKQFLLFWNINNLWCKSHLYILTWISPLYVVSKIGLSTIKYIFNTNLFSNVVIMWLNYVFVIFSVAEFEIMFIYKVYIYLPCINTQQQTTAPFLRDCHCHGWVYYIDTTKIRF